MTILSRTEQTGRSMVEMLGVLAIIGVLSVGGISGYSKAMSKFKLTKIQDQITMLLMNIRTAYAASPNYAGLDTDIAIGFGIAPSDMVSGATLKNAFNGAAYVSTCGTGVEGGVACSAGDAADSVATDSYFQITMQGLNREACMSLATADWGTDGLMSIIVNDNEAVPYTDLPLSLAGGDTNAAELCGDDVEGNNHSITWVYY